MANKVLYTVAIVIGTFFATLGIIFVLLLLWPDDDREETPAQAVTTEESAGEEPEAETGAEDGENEEPEVETDTDEDPPEEDMLEEDTQEKEGSPENTVPVSIPEEERSKGALKFKTVSLDGSIVTQDIFSDYDITLVHVWGTYCGPCISGMGDYAALYKELPDNVNLIGLVIDTYDGIDNNVSYAEEILGSVDAQFTNLRLSDDLYPLVSNVQVTPTSFFVDREGHTIGKMMGGQRCDKVKERLQSYLN